MRVQWVQVAMEVVEESAPDLAVLLETSEAEAGWGLIKLIKWFLGRVPENEYPSMHDLVHGPHAARLIASAAGYKGDSQRYVEALEELAKPILQIMADGVRMRGMNRYDAMLDEAEERSSKAKKAARARWGTGEPVKPEIEHAPSIARASSEQCSSNAPRCLDRDVDEDSESLKPPPPADTPPRAKLVAVEKLPFLTVADLTPRDRTRWKHRQRARRNVGLLRETDPPSGWPAFCDELEARKLGDEQVEHSHAMYLRDEHFADRKWPTALWIQPGIWRSRLPESAAEAAL